MTILDPDEFAQQVAKALLSQAAVGLWRVLCSGIVLLFIVAVATGLSALVRSLV